MAVYFASGIRLESEELGAGLALQPLVSATMRSALLWPCVNNTGETSFGSVFITFRNTSADMNSK